MDVFGHINHANMVTLLEEARVALLFRSEAGRELAKGVVVVDLAVSYRAPIVVGDQDVLMQLSLRECRHASFTIDYRVFGGPEETAKPAVTARTVLAPYDLASGTPRRLSETERSFLTERLGSGG
ncbi:acyl-CoA thioesterase [Amycolatopsis suaedae]|nr:thioesterase family protein [Amycolatopsis suaedae]